MNLIDRLDLTKKLQAEFRISSFDGIIIAGEKIHDLVSVNQDVLSYMLRRKLGKLLLKQGTFLFEGHFQTSPTAR